MSDPAEVGRVVLATLAAGRALRLERRRARAEELRDLVLLAERLDRFAGKPRRGQAGRIARRLQLRGVRITERWVRAILKTEPWDTEDSIELTTDGTIAATGT